VSRYVGTANTVQELIDLLAALPPDKPVRVLTLSHEWAPDVREHERCITLEP